MTSQLTTLVSFADGNGADPFAGLIADAAGNLFGTTYGGGTFLGGTVFEVAKTQTGYSSTPTVLASFNGHNNGAFPFAGLIADAQGNLFGTTEAGGASDDGTVFEIARTSTGYSSTPTVLASFDGTTGQYPTAGLIADAAGNLFGTTSEGGFSVTGTVFEIAKTSTGYSSTPTVLASFNYTEVERPVAGLIADEAGNLFGTIYQDPASDKGIVFKVARTQTGYSSTPTVLASFGGNNGANPAAGLIADAAGNLFGTTYDGGFSDLGTVFEIVKTQTGYSSTPTVLASFGGSNGQYPRASLIADAAGNLFGTTSSGGAGSAGTVFEIAKTQTGYSSTPTVLASFDGSNGAGGPYAGLIADAQGNLFGTTTPDGAPGYGTVFEITDSGFQTSPPCYCSGTRILAERGEVAVEDLAVGNRVVTASGEHRPIIWIGHRVLDISGHPDPATVWPVRVQAGAFGGGLPRRDLWLSPRHAVLSDGVLIPVIRLVNGASVAQVPVPCITYWHVELETHDVLLAEGLAAESYLDCGNRSGFANNGGVIDLYPDFAPKSLEETCSPLVETGPEIAAVRKRLIDEAHALGHSITSDPDLRLEAGATAITPVDCGDGWVRFVVPGGARDLRLTSRRWSPSFLNADCDDTRTLGVCISALLIDGQAQALDDLGPGWHPVEGSIDTPCRWTNGSAVLPSGARSIMVRIGGSPRYWVPCDLDHVQTREVASLR